MYLRLLPLTRLLTLLAVLLLLPACTLHSPPPAPSGSAPVRYSDDDYSKVLAGFRDNQGNIDYSALKADPGSLGGYYRSLARFSPTSHPEMFPTNNDEIAYWINAYNATVMWNVIQHYPIQSVLDVRTPILAPLLPKPAGFFASQRFTYGGVNQSLYKLEKKQILANYPDPRLHFALNCASRGCPILPGHPFDGARLDSQLENEARLFINNPDKVNIDGKSGTLELSSIFQWYESDFVDATNPSPASSQLIAYIARYLSPDRLAQLKQLGAEPKIQFTPYDWGLNDQAPSR